MPYQMCEKEIDESDHILKSKPDFSPRNDPSREAPHQRSDITSKTIASREYLQLLLRGRFRSVRAVSRALRCIHYNRGHCASHALNFQ